MIWFLAAPLVSRGVKLFAMLGTSLVIVILMGAPLIGYFVQPWAPWWLSGQHSAPVTVPSGAPVPVTIPSGPGTVPAGGVTDVQRYLLAIGAGFTGNDAIIAVAVSIAEDGSGNPAALSGVNFNGTRDLGLWQINSGWWPRFGGQAALTNPVTNAIAARYVFERQGWCAWSTYEKSCGIGHNSSYQAYMQRARAAAGSTQSAAQVSTPTAIEDVQTSIHIKEAMSGHLTDYPGIPEWYVLTTQHGSVAVEPGPNCRQVTPEVDVYAAYPTDNTMLVGQVVQLMLLGGPLIPPDDPKCQMIVRQAF